MAFDTAPSGPAFRNGLLAVLSDEDIEQLRPHLQQDRLVLEQVLHEPGEQMDHVYFPESGVVSLTADTRGTVASLGVQAAVAMDGQGSLAGWNFCPKPEPSVPL